MNLTQPELDFIPCLKAVDPASLWGIAIHNVLNDLTPFKFRLLVSDLKSQADDSNTIMLSILGNDCYKRLKSL